MNVEEKVKAKLLSRGFKKEQLLNNRGLIGAIIDETKEVVKNINYDTPFATVPYQCCPVCNGTGQTTADGFTSSVFQICKVCNGDMIIPQHTVSQGLANNVTPTQQ